MNVVDGMGPVSDQDIRYGDPHAPATPWADVLGVLEAAELFWAVNIASNPRVPLTTGRNLWSKSVV